MLVAASALGARGSCSGCSIVDIALLASDIVDVFAVGEKDALMHARVQDEILLAAYLEVDVEVHDVHDEVELAEVDLVLQQRVGVPRHLDEELVLQILRDFWVLEAMLVTHRLQQRQLSPMVQLKLSLVGLEEGLGFGVKLLEDHVQVEADEDREEDADELRLALVQGLVDEDLQL